MKAYLVAEKLARFYLAEKKEKPTHGTDYGGIPSTGYQRALEEIFRILGIAAQSRGPAKAACEAITEDDIKAARQPVNALAQLMRSQNF